MNNFRKLLFIVIVFTSYSTFAQGTLIDSLKVVLEKIEFDDTNKVDVLSNIVNELMYSEPNTALVYAEQSLKISENLNDNYRIFRTASDIGILYNERGDYRKARTYFEKALLVSVSDSVNLARTYGNIGNSYNYESESEQALLYYLKSLQIFEALNNLDGMSLVYGTIGNLYLSIHDYKNALDNYTKAGELFKKLDNQGGLATVYMNIGVVYRDGDKSYDKAINNFNNALEIYKNFNYKRGIAQSIGNIAEAHYNKGDYLESIKYMEDAIKIFQETNNKNEEALALIKIGDCYVALSNFLDAKNVFTQAYEIAYKDGNIKNVESSSLKLYQVYKKQNQLDKALFYHETFQNYHDSLFNVEKEKKLQELLTKYDTEKKEKEIQKQQFELEKQELQIKQKESTIRFYIILIVLVTIGLLLIAFAYFQKRRINILLKGQNALIAKQNNALHRDKKVLDEALKDKTEVLQKVYAEKKKTELPSELLQLSQREMEVLSYLALGWTDNQLADKLFVSKATIKTHLRRIYSKLLVNGRAGAVAIAHQYNIIGGVDEISENLKED